MVEPVTSVPLTRGQNQKFTVELDVDAICAEKLTMYCPASANTRREAGVPFVMPSAVLDVYVKAYAVLMRCRCLIRCDSRQHTGRLPAQSDETRRS